MPINPIVDSVVDPGVDQVVNSLAARWRALTLLSLGLLAAIVIVTQFSSGVRVHELLRAATFCVPLLLPIHGLSRHDRGTYKWATLCVLPYFVVAVTEAVADSSALMWAVAMLSASLLWFVTLVRYLRVTRTFGKAAR